MPFSFQQNSHLFLFLYSSGTDAGACLLSLQAYKSLARLAHLLHLADKISSHYHMLRPRYIFTQQETLPLLV